MYIVTYLHIQNSISFQTNVYYAAEQDGIELPRPIVFDVVDEAAKMPPSQRMFVADAKVQEIASHFLLQYFTIFDSENRQPLLDAYDERACFSMTITTSYNNK